MSHSALLVFEVTILVIAIFLGKFLQKQGVRIDWDGEQTRDYVYVGDVVRANVEALTKGSGEIFAIGTGKKTSVNEIYRAMFENAGVGITRVDLNGTLADINQKFCDMVGYTRDELLGTALSELTHPDDYGHGAAFRSQLKRIVGEI